MILFRTDGNKNIGSGHIMRCLAIANTASALGKKSVFVTSSDDMQKVINARGFENAVLHTDYQRMNEREDIALFEQFKPSAVVVDSYFVNENYLLQLHAWCKDNHSMLVYVDDILSFAYPCDVLINYNIYAPDMKREYKDLYAQYSDGEKPKYLLGLKYAPLREEFCNLSDRITKKQASRILVSSGGADTEHIALSILRKINCYPEYIFDFVIGSLNTDKEEIRKYAMKCTNAVLHENVVKMSELMQKADVAISSAGSTLYELCATQTPTVTYVLADNQILGANGFEKHNVLKCAGDIRKQNRDAFIDALLLSVVELCADYPERKSMAKRMSAIIDGHGCEQIIHALLGG